MICPNCKIEIPKRANGSYRCPKCIFVTFDNLTKITTMFAYLSVDHQGNEGIIAIQDKNAIIPMVASHIELMDEFRDHVKKTAKESKNKIKLVRFSNREELEEYS